MDRDLYSSTKSLRYSKISSVFLVPLNKPITKGARQLGQKPTQLKGLGQLSQAFFNEKTGRLGQFLGGLGQVS